MREAGGGSIVNISSVTGLVGSGRGGAYGASKAAVRLLTKHTAIQHARDGIRVNSISPGSVDTQMIAANIGTPEGRAASISRIPLGRIGTAQDVAYAALFLASDESSFMTGADLVIDGGMTAL
jgi:NAD(P)-dependent dehydrogenase (short-subunit alcohol dehydrogenase family)